MQVEVEKLGSLAEHVFYDQEENILYVSSRSIFQNSKFITWFNETEAKVGAKLKVKVDPQKVREKTRTVQRYDKEEEALKELVELLNTAASLRVSDIHFVSHKDVGCEVSFRINSLLKKVKLYSFQEGESIIRSVYTNSESPSETTYSAQSYQSGQLKKRNILPPELEAVRVQRGPTGSGEFAVLRLLYKETHIGVEKAKTFEETLYKSLGKYGYSVESIERIKRVLQGAEGLTIISGPTGSGKSTALKLMLELIHLIYPWKSIFTIEDPPEYIIRGAKQLPVPSSGSFAEVLKVALRSDPDIIMVGEVREEDTARTVINAVLTGHQVFTTLHAKDVPTILTRLGRLGIDIEEIMENEVIKLLISQRLVPKNCPHCAKPINYMGWVFYHSVGCSECNGTGISGREVIEESLSLEDIRYEIGWQGAATLKRIRDYLREKGRDLLSEAIAKALKGILSPKMVHAYVNYFDREDISRVDRTLSSNKTTGEAGSINKVRS